LVTLPENASERFEEYSSRSEIHYGEAESIALCKETESVFLTNDSVAVKFCREREVKALNLKDILIHSANREILRRKEMENLIEKIEDKDNTSIKFSKDILNVYRVARN